MTTQCFTPLPCYQTEMNHYIKIIFGNWNEAKYNINMKKKMFTEMKIINIVLVTKKNKY